MCGAYARYAPTLWASKVGPETEFTSANDQYPLFFLLEVEKRDELGVQNKPSYISFSVPFVGGNKNIFQNKRESFIYNKIS